METMDHNEIVIGRFLASIEGGAMPQTDPGTFEDLTRTPVPAGELVTFTLRWEENGVPHAVHQALLAEMADAGSG